MNKKFVTYAICAILSCTMQNQYGLDNFNTVCTDQIQTYADVIKLVTRIHKGVFQYRHWNETRGVWVEDDWISVRK